FFFQAEDGIRYRNVTGVQTCALPISINYYPCVQFKRRGFVYLLYDFCILRLIHCIRVMEMDKKVIYVRLKIKTCEPHQVVVRVLVFSYLNIATLLLILGIFTRVYYKRR